MIADHGVTSAMSMTNSISEGTSLMAIRLRRVPSSSEIARAPVVRSSSSCSRGAMVLVSASTEAATPAVVSRSMSQVFLKLAIEGT